MKKSLVAFLVSCAFGAFANEWYVDPVNGNDTYDGTSSNVVSDTTGPRRTLVGIMELVGDDDTVWLLPGDYAEKTVDAASDSLRRLEITNKSGLSFRSVAGRDKTAIVGRHDGTNGYDGPNAIGGVKISGSSANCVFEGITFRDCAGTTGGGVRDLTKTSWFIGCRFTNCCANTGGAMVQGNASGTEFVGCGGAKDGMVSYGVGTMEFCLFRSPAATGTYLFQKGGTFINCTVHGNKASVSSGPVLFCNSLVFGSSNNGASGAEMLWATNSWLGAAKNVNVGANAQTNADERAVRFVSPAMGDFRLTDFSEVTELGDAAYLALSPFPAGFVRKDVYGNPVTSTSGAIPAGCALEVVHQTAGRVDFSKAFEVRELGCSFEANDYFNPIREDYTYMFRPVTDAVVHNVQGIFGKELNSQKTAWVDSARYFFPLRQKGGWVPVGVRPEPISTNKFTFTSLAASAVYYADPINGSDGYDGLSSNVVDAAANRGPFKTLMGAMAKIDTGTSSKILYLMPGTYAEGCTETRPGNGSSAPYGVRYRVYVGTANLAIVGLEGPEKTFIVGAPHSETQELGPDAIGGVWLKSGTCRCVQGVTITGCYSTDTESTSYTVGGCAFYGGGSPSTHCYDCIISNNAAYCAPAKSYGTMVRCRILNNRSTAYMCVNGNPVGSCVFAGNAMGSTAKFCGTVTYGCTFDAELAGTMGGNAWYSLVLNRQQTDNLRQTCVDTVPLVADPDAFDYRLGSLSPAVLFGDLSARPVDSTYFFVCDVNGDKLEIKDGRMTVGAVHGGSRVPCVAISDGGVRGATVAGGAFGTNVVRLAGEVALTASVTRPLGGFSLNGAIIPATGLTCSFTPSADADAATFVSPVYGTDWYVNASAASDDAPGGAWGTARKTIRSATTNAVAGDVIHVAPGVYGEAEGAQPHAAGAAVPTRVIVPANVTLESSEGAEKTFIVGKGPDAADDKYGFMGSGSVKCVSASDGSEIRGFTITGGHTVSQNPGIAADKSYSAILGTTGTLVEDCIVSNNFGCNYSIYNATVRNSRILNNVACGSDGSAGFGAAGYVCAWEGCLFDGNRGDRQLYNPRAPIVNCTIGTKNRANADGTGTNPGILGCNAKNSGPILVNTLWAAGKQWVSTTGGSFPTVATNCIIQSGVIDTSGGIKSANCVNCYTNYTTANITASVIDADCRLRAGSPAIDAGTNDLMNLARDLDGDQRIWNAAVDIGAFEYDWRGQYKKDLGRHATAVTEASPEVVETESGTVRIPSGTLVGTLRPGDVQLNFTVTGGTLAVWLGETLVGEFDEAAESQSVKLEPTEANNEFRLAFTPTAADGCAEIARLKGLSGLLLLAR